MSDIKIKARRLTDNREVILENIKSLEISASLESPAVSMSAVYAPSAAAPGFGAITVYNGNTLLFSGKVDSQKTTISANGIEVLVDARDAGAALLDNQAYPCVMFYTQLSTFFKHFIAPYGFSLYNPNTSAYIPMFTVRQGMSEWDALISFTRRAYGITPYVTGSQIMLRRRRSGAPITISNTGAGVCFTSLAHSLTPYNVISQVFLRDEEGIYSTVVNNSAAVHTESRRKRFIIPPTEYVDLPALNANQRIRRSMFMAEGLVATLPGIIDAELGRDVQIKDKLLTRYNLMVVKREHIINKDGMITRLTLASSVYYD